MSNPESSKASRNSADFKTPSRIHADGNNRGSGNATPGSRWVVRAAIAVVLVSVAAGAVVLVERAFRSDETAAAMTHTIARGNLIVSVTERGTLESSNNTEIKCKVRGFSTVTWVVDSGSIVAPGDELVRLDTRVIEETVSLTKTNVDLARAKLERSKANYARAKIAIDAYLKGQFRSELKTLEKDRVIAESNLLTAGKMLRQSQSLFRRGYVTDLEVKGHTFTVKQAELELKVKETQIDVLERFTKKMQLEGLEGTLRAAKSKMAADTAELAMTTKQRSRALEELDACVVKAERGGLVIYPSAAEWKDTPDVTEGATVRKDQVLLLMPDLSKMQVKIGVHESIVDRVKEGLPVRITLPDRTLDAKVTTVSTVASAAGWWTGNVVKYDVIIELPAVAGLKPGMSAEVEVVIARYDDVIAVPVAAVVATEDGDFVWVKTTTGPERRRLQLGDTNDRFIVVEGGLALGDDVFLNPLAFIAEAQHDALRSKRERSRGTENKLGAANVSEPPPGD